MLITLHKIKNQQIIIKMLLTFLDTIEDQRRSQGRRYELKHILLFSVLSFLSNSKSYRDIARFIDNHFERLKKDFKLTWKKPPGYTTIRNIIQGVVPGELEKAFRSYNHQLMGEKSKEKLVSISIDGKTLRGSFDNINDKSARQLISVFETTDKLILAHEVVDEKTNEIPIVQALLMNLDLEKYCYTIDALHCQKKLFRQQKQGRKI